MKKNCSCWKSWSVFLLVIEIVMNSLGIFLAGAQLMKLTRSEDKKEEA